MQGFGEDQAKIATVTNFKKTWIEITYLFLKTMEKILA
jgi:hypothetical protein